MLIDTQGKKSFVVIKFCLGRSHQYVKNVLVRRSGRLAIG